ncbi:hypothetical protein PR003_g13783 [Phytophthora rubi]|uniref:SET domain-containing protein n=1 Tax=Phytophthora rubi TaxID=129364 RepID=A0A6A4F7L5_9STRA|nr:hypothetical protein PR002_g2116 [Phytophthora rubi]KAE9050461.1 hypothetical protein PR001_g2361 [Phytophthora rubi]KAE9333920.1 hypothetical protein PR003_g13783 [Phytophthora rubi]
MIPVAISDHVWPDGSRKLSENENPESVRFPDYGDLDPCDCSRDCFCDVCDNAGAGIYCTADNCAAGGRCSNNVYDCQDVEVVSTSLGYGDARRAPGFIPVDTVIGEYTGILTTHDYDKDKDVTSEYVMKLQTRASRKKVYIDAKEGGGLTRFINHSCAPNCVFAEARNRRSTKVLVIVVRPIRAGADVTVSYGDELWFTCACGEGNCQ